MINSLPMEMLHHIAWRIPMRSRTISKMLCLSKHMNSILRNEEKGMLELSKTDTDTDNMKVLHIRYMDGDLDMIHTFDTLCVNGHMDSAKWLWDLSKDSLDIHRDKEDAFCVSCEGGHMDVAAWLWELSEETIDLHITDEYPILIAASRGHGNIVKWLHDISRGTIDVHIDDERLFKIFCMDGDNRYA